MPPAPPPPPPPPEAGRSTWARRGVFRARLPGSIWGQIRDLRDLDPRGQTPLAPMGCGVPGSPKSQK
jgi:hypothetical protein